MSNRAQGVKALKQWILPPVVGPRTVVPHGADMSPSRTSLAGLAVIF